MALPKIKHPTYKVTIPSTKQEVTMRPFTVQEEKLLLMAKSTEKNEDILLTIKQVIQNCIIEPVDVEKLATFDVEYLFIKLRAKSIGEFVDLEYTDEDTNEVYKFQVNLDQIEVNFNPAHTNKISISDEIGLVLKYPTLEEIKLLESGQSDEENVFKILLKCVDKIYDKETVYSDYTDKDLEDFLNSLPMDSMGKIKEFFETMPVVEHTVKIPIKKGKGVSNKEVVLRGINSFFT